MEPLIPPCSFGRCPRCRSRTLSPHRSPEVSCSTSSHARDLNWRAHLLPSEWELPPPHHPEIFQEGKHVFDTSPGIPRKRHHRFLAACGVIDDLARCSTFSYVAASCTGRIAIRLDSKSPIEQAIPLAQIREDGTWDINGHTAQVFLKMSAVRLKLLFTQRALANLKAQHGQHSIGSKTASCSSNQAKTVDGGDDKDLATPHSH